MGNMLQHNVGNGKFKEMGQLSGVVKTDWVNFFGRFDNDGLKDIFISNGGLKIIPNQDFRTEMRTRNANGESMTLMPPWI